MNYRRKPKPYYKRLFHGTSSKLLPQIRRRGLNSPSYMKGWMGVFLTDDRDGACAELGSVIIDP